MDWLYKMELPFYTYGILMGIAFVLGVLLFQYNSERSALPRPSSTDLILLLSIFGVLGARINYILLFPQYFNGLRDCIALHEGGLVFYGGMISAILALFIYCKIKHYSFLMVTDYMVPSLALGQAIGRVGCFVNGCCYGAITEAIKIYHLKGDSPNVFRHPTQIYEIIYLIIFAVIFTFILKTGYQEKATNRGIVATSYIVFYSIARFLNEGLRADARGGFFTDFRLSPAQVTSIMLFICGILFVCSKGKFTKITKTEVD